MNELARKILESSRNPGVKVLYGVMASDTTVRIGGTATAVTVPILDGAGVLEADDYVMLVADGPDVAIVGSLGASPIKSFTPSFSSGIGLVDGTFNGRYRYKDGVYSVWYSYVAGASDTSTTSVIEMSLPSSFVRDSLMAVTGSGVAWLNDGARVPAAAVFTAAKMRLIAGPDGGYISGDDLLTGGSSYTAFALELHVPAG